VDKTQVFKQMILVESPAPLLEGLEAADVGLFERATCGRSGRVAARRSDDQDEAIIDAKMLRKQALISSCELGGVRVALGLTAPTYPTPNPCCK
jgi:hypothetical protein